MRHAVILSSFIPNTEVARAVGEYYINLIRKRFSDCAIYVGINTGSSDDWRDMLSRCGLDIIACEVPKHLSVSSDVAGFQAVLRTLRIAKSAHDYYWFGHTKGATHHQYSDAELLREVIDRDFWSRRAEIEDRCDTTRYGTFAALPMPASGRNTQELAYLRSIFPGRYSPVGVIPTYTFFGMTGVVLRNFLGSADERFFDQNLVETGGVSRYFFEGTFPWIADLTGFEPYLLRKEFTRPDDPALNWPSHPNDFAMNRQRAAQLINAWRSDREGFDFPGWPVWAGQNIEYQDRIHDTGEFFRAYPNYSPPVFKASSSSGLR
ncbi:hypothetical protein [Methylobacterium sp. Leaf100]|uniref:hypothetical protein n=1 Tax=Methylobacterium sp. Leaf100 TaxID=1736252 RepID=UPI000AB69AB7|nr:hypothetical protein [Methylobacterium sp. Leaf100]